MARIISARLAVRTASRLEAEAREDEGWAWAQEMLGTSLPAVRLQGGLNGEIDGRVGVQDPAGNATLLVSATEQGQGGKNPWAEKRKPDFRRYSGFPGGSALWPGPAHVCLVGRPRGEGMAWRASATIRGPVGVDGRAWAPPEGAGCRIDGTAWGESGVGAAGRERVPARPRRVR